jgi:putative ABC transport system substrate-binding protein
MRRRDFFALCAGLGISSLAHAQQPRLHRVGVLLLGIADAESFKTELREGLRTSGYTEGQNVAFEFRSAEGNQALLPKLAAELVALKVDVIVALFTPCAIAAKQATREIPIVVVSATRSGQVL